MDKRLFFLVHQAHRKLFREANKLSEEDIGAPVAQIAALFAIHNGATQINEIGSALKLNRAATSELISRMEASGLVVKKQSPTDGRAQVVAMTKKGKNKHDKALPVIANLNTRIAGTFSDSEMEVIIRFLQRLINDF